MQTYTKGLFAAALAAAMVVATAIKSELAADEPRGEALLAKQGVPLDQCVKAHRGIISWLGVNKGLVLQLEDGPDRWAAVVMLSDSDVRLSCTGDGRMEVVRDPIVPR
jgi:hypothetical protein